MADEIRNLSTETQESSSRIMAALANLGTTSVKMTDSIGQTIDLIQETSEKVAVVNESVSGIAKDAAELEQHLSVIDSAVQDVKESNHQMVSNMEGICNVMNAMTDSIGSADGSIREKTPYDIQIVVDNVLYNWTDVLANVENEQGRDV